MGKIFASVDAVNHKKTHSTQVPLDVVLTREECDELYLFEEQAKNARNSAVFHTLNRQMSATTNVGLHYYALEDTVFLPALVLNQYISPMVAFLARRKVFSLYATRPEGFLFSQWRQMFAGLLMLPMNKHIPNWTGDVLDSLNKLGQANITDDLFVNYVTRVNDYSAEVFVELGSRYTDLCTLLEDDFRFTAARPYGFYDWVERNLDAIQEYLKETGNPMYDLPLDWIYEVWGIPAPTKTYYVIDEYLSVR